MLKQKDLIYDVGMHEGEDTDYYLKKGFRVIGFEAMPNLAAHCRNRFANEIQNGQLVIVEGAITDIPSSGKELGTVKFYSNIDNSAFGTVDAGWAKRNEHLGTASEVIEVKAINFAECLNKYGIPYYMKIDIEGMDSVCLKSLINFDERPDYVSMESEKVSFDKLINELELLKRLGYAQFKAVQQKDKSRVSEPNPSFEGKGYLGYAFQEGSSGLFGTDLPRKWKTFPQIVDEYKCIFRLYKLFGDYGTLNNYFLSKILKRILSRLRRPIPGWYDTHAKHGTVDCETNNF